MAAINLFKSRVNCVLTHIGWQRGVVVSIFRRMIQVTQRRERLVMGDGLRTGIPSRYVTSQPGQLSLVSLLGH